MLEWLSRETVVDISINGAPLFILAYFAVLIKVASPWTFDPLPVVLTHALTLFPLVVLVFATYYAARAIERDAARSAPATDSTEEPSEGRLMSLPSIYTPEGTFAYTLVVLGLALVATVVYLLAFAGATVPS